VRGAFVSNVSFNKNETGLLSRKCAISLDSTHVREMETESAPLDKSILLLTLLEDATNITGDRAEKVDRGGQRD